MADIERFGRTFSFDDSVSSEQQERRVQNWMQKHAPEDLKSIKTDKPAQQPGAERVSAPAKSESKSNFNPTLAMLSQVLLGPLGGVARGIPGVASAMGDVNTYRTLAQGALPFADEITAGVRSLAGTPYDTALSEERQGVKDFGTKYGEIPKTALELTGALATLPLGIGAVKAITSLPKGAKLAELMIKHPWLSAAGTGAATGAVTGFGAGEEGFGSRAGNAADMAKIGAVLGPLGYAGVKTAKSAGNWLNTDSKVGEYLKKRIGTEKKLDPKSPTFESDADAVLTRDLSDQLHLRTDPRAADLLPETTEAVLQKPGRGSAELAESLMERQYDKNLPEAAARAEGQHGRVKKAFDTAFGNDMFQQSDEALLSQRRANAQQLYAPAYTKNVRTNEIDDALDRLHILSPNIWSTAKKWADAERRPIGTVDAVGNLRKYNTQFLHDLKRSMDQVLGEEGRMNPKFNQVPFNNAKSDLNKAIMKANPEYETAMKQYGDDSGLMSALEKGRKEVFVPGSVDMTGAMDDRAIKDYLNDPNLPQAAKDLFLTGAARSLRESVLASQSKKYTHNWADIINNPEYEKRIGALLSGRQLGAWDLFRGQLKKESENFKGASRAMGNSRTNARQELMKEMEGPQGLASALSLGINPKTPGGWRAVGQMALDKLSRAGAMADKTASILAKKGPAGNRASLDEIARLLRASKARDSRFKDIGALAPGAAAYTYPYRED